MPAGNVPLDLGSLASAIDPAVQIYFQKSGEFIENQYEQFVNVDTDITDRTTQDAFLGGMTQFARVLENAVITAESPPESNAKSYVQVEFADMIRVTRQAMIFGLEKRSLQNQVEELRKAAVRKKERDCADLLNNMTAATYTVTDRSGSFTKTITGADNVAFSSAAHTREDGGTNWNNRVTDGTTVNMDFDYDAIKAAHRTAKLILDASGQEMNISLDTVIVRKGSPNQFRAYEILNAVGIPGGNENDANAVKMMPYKILPLAYLTADAPWMMFDSKMKSRRYGPQLKMKEDVTLHKPDIEYLTGEIRWKGTMLYDYGTSDARNFVCSTGANA